MKRIWSGLLCLMMLLGCSASGQPQGEEYELYFRARDLETVSGEDALVTRPLYLDYAPQGVEELAQVLMEALLEGPEDPLLQSTLPDGMEMLSLTVDGSQATVDLDTAYRTLSGVELALADYAIVLTLTQLPQIYYVKITVRGEELSYRSQQVLTARDVFRIPSEDVVSTVAAALYFPNEEGTLVAETRQLEIYEGETQVGTLVWALEDGPQEEGLLPIMPEGFGVTSVWMEEDTCYVNFSSATITEEVDLALIQESIDRSLRSLQSVNEVLFLVDGEFLR